MDNIASQLMAKELAGAKAAYTTRRVTFEKEITLINTESEITPQSGDLILAKVNKIGYHKRLELTNGRRARLFVDDKVVLCYGNRYAPDQYEAVVPDSLAPCHLAAAGGIMARVLSRHKRMKRPTELYPLGILVDINGQSLNLADFALKKVPISHPRPLTIAVLGTAMNSGKTTTAAYLIKGLVRSGLKVGAAKITGTGAGGDVWFMKDAGADPVLDFIDAGFASTYKATLNQIKEIFDVLMSHLIRSGADVIVLELADGLYQDENSDMLHTLTHHNGTQTTVIKQHVDGIIFAPHDAMGASAGVEELRRCGLSVLALSGAMTQSPLAVREAQEASGLPVINSDTLSNPEIVDIIRNLLANHRGTKSVLLRAV